jgi:Aldo/keto reductase family
VKYRLLGKSGLRVSEASLGTMTFGDEWGWGSPKDEAQKIYETYREAGGNFIDTANFYTGGTSEKLLGEFMQGHRDSVVLATKYSNAAPGNDPNACRRLSFPFAPALLLPPFCCRMTGNSEHSSDSRPQFRLRAFRYPNGSTSRSQQTFLAGCSTLGFLRASVFLGGPDFSRAVTRVLK